MISLIEKGKITDLQGNLLTSSQQSVQNWTPAGGGVVTITHNDGVDTFTWPADDIPTREEFLSVMGLNSDYFHVNYWNNFITAATNKFGANGFAVLAVHMPYQTTQEPGLLFAYNKTITLVKKINGSYGGINYTTAWFPNGVEQNTDNVCYEFKYNYSGVYSRSYSYICNTFENQPIKEFYWNGDQTRNYETKSYSTSFNAIPNKIYMFSLADKTIAGFSRNLQSHEIVVSNPKNAVTKLEDDYNDIFNITLTDDQANSILTAWKNDGTSLYFAKTSGNKFWSILTNGNMIVTDTNLRLASSAVYRKAEDNISGTSLAWDGFDNSVYGSLDLRYMNVTKTATLGTYNNYIATITDRYTLDFNNVASNNYTNQRIFFTPTTQVCTIKLDLSGIQGRGNILDVKDIGVYEIGGEE